MPMKTVAKALYRDAPTRTPYDGIIDYSQNIQNPPNFENQNATIHVVDIRPETHGKRCFAK